jgi:hypothetical protein
VNLVAIGQRKSSEPAAHVQHVVLHVVKQMKQDTGASQLYRTNSAQLCRSPQDHAIALRKGAIHASQERTFVAQTLGGATEGARRFAAFADGAMGSFVGPRVTSRRS